MNVGKISLSFNILNVMNLQSIFLQLIVSLIYFLCMCEDLQEENTSYDFKLHQY